jgi:hypothetical protein
MQGILSWLRCLIVIYEYADSSIGIDGPSDRQENQFVISQVGIECRKNKQTGLFLPFLFYFFVGRIINPGKCVLLLSVTPQPTERS